MSDENQVEVSRWYTHTRKFPQFVGKTHNGTSIWGGPYTYTQIGVFVAIVYLGSQTVGWWARGDIITSGLTLVAVAYGVALLAGKLPIGLRSPLSVLAGAAKAYSRPMTGRYRGERVRFVPPHQVKGNAYLISTGSIPDAVAAVDAPDAAALASPPTISGRPAAVAQLDDARGRAKGAGQTRRPALSGVQLLLAAQPPHTMEKSA